MSQLRMTRREAQSDRLPMVCMRCGKKATCRRHHVFTWYPPHVRMFAGGLLGAVLMAAYGKSMRMQLPLCEKDRGHFWWPIWVLLIGLGITLGIAILGILIAVAGTAAMGPAGGAIGVAVFGLCFVGFIATLIMTIVASFKLVRPLEITDRDITLVGLSDRFIDAFEDQRRRIRSGKYEEDEEEEPAPRPRRKSSDRDDPRIRPEPLTRGSVNRRSRDEEDEDDEDDYRPARRRPNHDEDDEEDEPRKKSSLGLMIGIGGAVLGVFALVICGGVLVIIANANSGNPGPGANVNPPPGQGPGPFLPPNNQAPEFRNLAEAIAGLKDPEAERRLRATEWLATVKPDPQRQAEVAKLLDPLANDPDIFLRAGATRALLVWATKDNVPTLIRIANDRSAVGDMRQQAIQALGRTGDERAIPVLVPKLTDFGEHDNARDALAALGSTAEGEVVKYFHHPDGTARNDARTLIKGYGTRDTVILGQTVDDLRSNDSARRQAALDWIKTAPVNPDKQADVAGALAALLKEKDIFVRENAARALAVWATKDNMPALAAAINDDSQAVRKIAIDLGLQFKDERIAAPLAARLATFDRTAAVKALQTLGPVAEPEVLKYANHKDFGTREAARSLLKAYGTKESALLTQALDDVRSGEDDRQREAANWLAEAKVDPEKQKEAAQALEFMIDNLDYRIREPGLKALKVWAVKESVPGLLKVVNDKTDNPNANFCRAQAMEVLGMLKDERAIEPIARFLPNFFQRNAARKALIAMGADAEKKLIVLLQDPDRNLRKEVASVLGEVGTKASLPALQKAAIDPDRFVQMAAKEAMQAIGKRQ